METTPELSGADIAHFLMLCSRVNYFEQGQKRKYTPGYFISGKKDSGKLRKSAMQKFRKVPQREFRLITIPADNDTNTRREVKKMNVYGTFVSS